MPSVKSYLPDEEHRLLRAVVAARDESIYAYVQRLIRNALREDARELVGESP